MKLWPHRHPLSRRASIVALLLCAALLSPAPSSAEEPRRLLAFGDSLTEGFGLPPEQGLVPVLEDWLHAQGHESLVINAGLTGDTSYGGRIRIRWALRHAADAVIVEIGANDFLMGWQIPEIERNLDEILIRAKGKAKGKSRPVLLVGLGLPPGSDPKAAAEVREMWLRLAARHEVLLLPDLYAPIWAAPSRRAARYLQADRMHLSAEGVDLVVRRALGPAVLRLLEDLPPG